MDGVAVAAERLLVAETSSRPEAHRVEQREPAVFRKDGDVWQIAYGDATCQLNDTRGLQYIAQLLRHAGRELHASELVGAAGGQRTHAAALADQPVVSGLGDAGPVLDAQATGAYQRRLSELREDLAEAETRHDLGRTARLREELAFLKQELASTGRNRRSASHAERARLTVSKGIAAAMKRISAAHPTLAAHLRATIRTGYFCRYTPDPRVRIDWLLGLLGMIFVDLGDGADGLLDTIDWLSTVAAGAFWG